jgi:hypothetical protein
MTTDAPAPWISVPKGLGPAGRKLYCAVVKLYQLRIVRNISCIKPQRLPIQSSG